MDFFVSAITTNFTSFFREAHHFDFIAKEVKALLKRQSRVRIWSAGCSSGEEPYSIAITLLNAIPDIAKYDVKILATDLDSQMVAKAKAGVYAAERIEGIDPTIRERWFRRGSGDNAGMVRVRDDARNLLTFKQLNLLQEWPIKGPMDIIFCRNVIIYFNKDVQRRLFSRYASVQNKDGFLIIGHSENITGVTDQYSLIGRTIYQRR